MKMSIWLDHAISMEIIIQSVIALKHLLNLLYFDIRLVGIVWLSVLPTLTQISFRSYQRMMEYEKEMYVFEELGFQWIDCGRRGDFSI